MACGPTALSLAGRLLDYPVSQEELARVLGGLNHPSSLTQIKEAADTLGFHTMALRCNPLEPNLAPIPMIVCLKGTRQATEDGHFVVLCGMVEGKIQLLDYPRRPRLVAPSGLAKHWDGRGLFIASSADQLAMLSANGSTPAVWFIGALGVVIIASIVVYGVVWETRRLVAPKL